MNHDAFRTIGKVLDTYAVERPVDIALVFVSRSGERRTMTFAGLKAASDKAAHIVSKAVTKTPFLAVIELANTLEHIVWAIGIWKAGGCCAPISPRLAEQDRETIFGQLQPEVTISGKDGRSLSHGAWIGVDEFWGEFEVSYEWDGVPPAVPCKVIMTAGTTGKPKAVYQDSPMGTTDTAMNSWFEMSGQAYNYTQLLVGPLGHGAAGSSAFMGMMAGQKLIILEKFNAEQVVGLIEEYRVQAAMMVPTMMKRIADVPEIDRVDLSSFKSLCHTGSYCSQELKQRWIDLIGAEHLYEIYSMSEAIGMTIIRGDEWLAHQGSVGKPFNCEVQIRDHGDRLPAGEVGEIYMKPCGEIAMDSSDLKHAKQNQSSDGFFTVGDMGYLSDDGYLYFSDRRSDMIITGGMNVFACEVERALLSSPWVSEAAVIGVKDTEWGQKIRAYMVLNPGVGLPQSDLEAELKAFLKKSLSSYKVPKEFCVVPSLPKSEVGKVLRSELRKQVAN